MGLLYPSRQISVSPKNYLSNGLKFSALSVMHMKKMKSNILELKVIICTLLKSKQHSLFTFFSHRQPTMTDYNLIFGGILLFNIIVTFRASSYWAKYFPKAISETKSTPTSDNGDDEDPSPLISSKSSDESKDIESGNDESKGSAASDAAASIRHSHLLRKYLVVYLLAAFSDWLQGPYVYALYDAYGYSQHDIAVLFVAGFGSSMVFGSFVGGMADQ